ncbi:MAG TPA: DUF1707 domain-containing protein [Streptosporangiaceae bacterium]|jgi:hypothetical protein|nr:DUF1707 domain-containing protein [Streptosporangiaceae bacterium]
MSTDDAVRASDADREHTVTVLRDGYACGRITLAEFDERTTAALAGRTWGELRELTRDLPAARTTAYRAGGQQPAGALAGGGARLLPVLAIALIWLTVTLTAHSPDVLIPVVFLLLMAVRFAARIRCGFGGPGRRCQEQPGRSRQPGGPGRSA